MAGPADDRGEMLRLFLAGCDEPCPGCGYNLRGLTGENCPECGEALRLRVGMVEPRLGPFVAGLIGLAAGAGFNGIMTVFGAVGLLIEGGNASMRDYLVLTLLACAFGAGVGAIAAWVRYRAWVRRRSGGGRLGMALACWAFSLGTVSAFLVVAMR